MPRRANRNLLPDEEIGTRVAQDVEWGRDYRRPRKDTWLRLYRLYKNYIDQANYPFEANLAIPTAFTIIEVQNAFIMDMINEAGDFVDVMGKTPEGQASARAVKEMLNYHFRNSIQTFEDMESYIRQLLMYGTSIYKVFWKYVPGWKTKPEISYNEDGSVRGYKRILSPVELENKPFGYVVDNWNFLVDPNASVIGDARYVAEEMWVDPITLREKEQLGIGYRNIDEAIHRATDVNSGLRQRFSEINEPSNQDALITDNKRSKVHLVDYWGYLVKGWENGNLKKNAKQQLYHAIVAMPEDTGNGGGAGEPTVIFAEPSPFYHNKIPYVDSRINNCVGEFYGVGDIEYCESLLHEQRDMRNIELDNLNRTMNKMFVVDRNADVLDSECEWRPSGIIHANNIDGVKMLDVRPLDPASFRAQDDIRRDIEQVTGVNDFVVGQFRSSTGFNDTATGVSLIQQTALKRIGHKGQIIQRAIKNIGHMVFSLVAQYQPWGTTVRILDRESAMQARFIDISPAALQHNYDFHIVNAPALGSKPLRQNQLIQLLQIMVQAKQDPNGGFNFDLDRFMRRLLDEMDIPNPQEFFGFPEFQQNLPPELGEPVNQEELVDPEEENRLMIEQGQVVAPKMEENHPQHMTYHQQAYEGLPSNHPAKFILMRHHDAHRKMAEQTRDLMAMSLQSQTLQAGAQSAENQANMLTTGQAESPNRAGGQEDVTRAFGNLLAGNA